MTYDGNQTRLFIVPAVPPKKSHRGLILAAVALSLVAVPGLSVLIGWLWS